MPRGRGDIDHIAVAPTGVYVIDTKAWKGKVAIARPLFGQTKLMVNGSDRTKAIDGLDGQVAAVKTALDRAGHSEVPIQGVLCFTQADLPWLRTQTLRGHLLLYRRAIAKRLNAEGPLSGAAIDTLAHVLGSAFPPA